MVTGLKLTPKTKRGKQITQSHGQIWIVLWEQDSVQCFGGGPGLFIQSVDTGETRWIMPDGSPHFTKEN